MSTRVSITFDIAALGRRRLAVADACAEVSRLLTGLEAGLGGCGATVLGRSRADGLAWAVRSAFDPAARGDLHPPTGAPGGPILGWDDAGPLAVAEEWDRYRHDNGTSVSWGWREAPRQQVPSDVLARLLSPGRYQRRVTVLYRPLLAGEAARTLESQVNAAAFRDAYRRAQRRDETARDVTDREMARRAAQEEAMGAGVVLLSVYVTTTVREPAFLDEAVADVEARADQCRIRLRRLYGGQAAGFATTLPLGVHPAHLTRRRLR